MLFVMEEVTINIDNEQVDTVEHARVLCDTFQIIFFLFCSYSIYMLLNDYMSFTGYVHLHVHIHVYVPPPTYNNSTPKGIHI